MLSPLSTSIFQYLVDEAADAVLIMDAEYRVRYVNPAIAILSGYRADELIGKSIDRLLPDSAAWRRDEHGLSDAASFRTATMPVRVREVSLRHHTDELIPIELKAVDLGVESGTRYFGAIMVDLRPRRAVEAKNTALMTQLAQQALTDALTGLPNRRAFDLEAAGVMAHAKREGWPVTVGIADLDWFKKVNDQYGHAAGDTVLRNVAEIIQRLVRAGDLFGRIGGEEFGLLMPKATAMQATAIAERIRASLADSSIELPSHETIKITISIGLAQLDSTKTFDAALAQADAALYQAKLTGRNRVVVAQ